MFLDLQLKKEQLEVIIDFKLVEIISKKLRG